MSKTLLERATASGPRLYLTQFALGTGRGTGLQITLGAEYVSISSPREANEIAQTILKWVHEETEARSRAGIPLDQRRVSRDTSESELGPDFEADPNARPI